MTTNDLKRTLASQRSDLLDRLLIVLTALVMLAVVGSLVRSLDIGWQPVMGLHLGIVALLVALTALRRRLPYAVKVWIIAVLFFVAALAGLLSFGLVGGNLGIWFALPLFVAALIGTRVAIATIALTMAIFAIVAWLSLHGMLHAHVDYQALVHSRGMWLNAIAALPLFAYMPVLIISNLNAINRRLMENLDEQNRKLAQLNRVKDTMFSVIAHDLRAPFQGLIGTLELVEDDSRLLEKLDRTHIFSALLDDARSTHRMLENLLLWARSEVGESPPEIRQHSLAELVAEACAPYRSLAQKKQIHIEQAIDRSLELACDAASLRIVVANLVSNAIKFSHPGSAVTVSACRESGALRLAVQDSGVGIEPGQIAKMLDPDQVYTTYGTGNEKGVGLGMKICLKLARQNGAALQVDSVAGRGSTITLVFPAPG